MSVKSRRRIKVGKPCRCYDPRHCGERRSKYPISLTGFINGVKVSWHLAVVERIAEALNNPAHGRDQAKDGGRPVMLHE